MKLTWTTTSPTKPGWYWWRGGSASELLVREIRQGAYLYDLDTMYPLYQIGGEWAGPIPVPEEGKG